MKPHHHQARLDALQDTYRQWLALKPALYEAKDTLSHAMQLMQQLEHSYFGAEFAELMNADNQGTLDTRTPGEYSVLGEDTIWNELAEKDELLWSILKLCIAHLDKSTVDNQPSD